MKKDNESFECVVHIRWREPFRSSLNIPVSQNAHVSGHTCKRKGMNKEPPRIYLGPWIISHYRNVKILSSSKIAYFLQVANQGPFLEKLKQFLWPNLTQA